MSTTRSTRSKRTVSVAEKEDDAEVTITTTTTAATTKKATAAAAKKTRVEPEEEAVVVTVTKGKGKSKVAPVDESDVSSAAGGSGASTNMVVDTPSSSSSSSSSSSTGNKNYTIGGKWLSNESSIVHYQSSGLVHSTKIAGFDIDDTIITTISGKTFATGPSDWKFWHSSVPTKLQSLHSNGYKIVFFSNQAGIGKGKVRPQDFKAKLENVIAALQIPVQVVAAISEDKFRKPCTGMWDLFADGSVNGGVVPVISQSVYVGDAAGRGAGWKPGYKKDFSDTDRKFALNVGLPFFTPEEYFLNEKAVPFTLSGINPKEFLEQTKSLPTHSPSSAKLTSVSQEMIIMTGYPGAGKSTFVKNTLIPAGYVHINRDTLKTKEKCLAQAILALQRGDKVVIDNTSPKVSDRAPYIAAAQKLNIPVRSFVMNVSFDQASHNNQYRELVTNGVHKHVPSMVYYGFRKDYEEPSNKEGFSEVVKINFKPNFASAADELLFSKYAHD